MGRLLAIVFIPIQAQCAYCWERRLEAATKAHQRRANLLIGGRSHIGMRVRWRKILGAACCCSLLAAHPAEPVEPVEPALLQPAQAAPAATGTLPKDAYQTAPAIGVPYSKLFRNTDAPYNNPLYPIGVSPTARTESVNARASLAVPINASFPLLQRGFEPRDADLKLGPLFFKLRELSGAVLWSDNIHLLENNRESGTIAITTISGAIIAQLTEGLRLAVSGSFVYLPLQNEAGVAGFGLYAPYVLGLGDQPLAHSEITWNTQIGDWTVVFADDFRIGIGRFSNSLRDNAVLFEGGDFDGRDTAGRYSFGANNSSIRRSNGRRRESRNDGGILYFSNIVSAQTDRLIVGKTRLRIQGSHENLWYNQGNRGLPGLRDQLNVSLVSERENLRFKPFAMYSAMRTDTQNSFNQTLRVGLEGPITDQLHFHGEVGYFFGDNRGRLLWALRLQHQAGPYTEELLYYRRSVSDFNDEISEIYGYNIRQILGPKMVADAFISHANVEALRRDGFSRTETRAGVRLRIHAGPRTEITLVGTGAIVSADRGDYRLWTGRAEIDHYFTDTLLARLSYQYQQRDSDFRGDSYYENLIYFSLSKYFN